jgi:hypothetical protein
MTSRMSRSEAVTIIRFICIRILLGYVVHFLLVEKGPAAEATDAPQPSGLLCNPVMKMERKMISFFLFFRVMEHRWNEIDRKNRSTWGKPCPSATLSTTNPTWTDPGSKQGLRCERPATNRLSHGTIHS